MPTALLKPEPEQDFSYNPAILDALSKIWTVFYRHGVNSTLSKNIYVETVGENYQASMRIAVERAQKHCGIMGYKYIFIRPMVCPIEIEEGIQLGHISPVTLRPKDA